MRRRDFITLLGGAAAWSLPARAQQPAIPVIGFLNGASPDKYIPMVAAFRQGLREAGYIETQNVAIEFRWADGKYDRLPELATDLVRRQVSVINAGGTATALAAKAATTTIPVVFSIAADPVEIGLVSNLKRPDGNLTGVTTLATEVGPKRLELMHEVMPAGTMALLVNPGSPILAEADGKELQAAANKVGVQLHIVHAGSERELEPAFASLAQKRVAGLIIGTDQFFITQMQQLAELSVRYSVPAIYQDRLFAATGGLMSYGGSIPDAYRLVGTYVGKILDGEKPANLPVQQSTKVELIVNLKTARAFGLTVPTALLVRADEVIE
jgi:putative ABC transport system substrate-binding protein